MRVLLLHYTFPSTPGGVEIVMARHAIGLRDIGADVAIVAGRGRSTVRGVRAIRVPEMDSRHPLVERAYAALARGEIPPELGRLRQRLRARLGPLLRRADRVVAHNVLTLHKNHALALALHDLAPTLPRGRLIAWVHDLAWVDARYAAERHTGEPWDVFARAAPGVSYVAVSDARRDEAASLLGLARERIAVVPNGVDPLDVLGASAGVRALAARLRLTEADPLLLLPARLTRRKRIEAAIDAAAELRRRGRDAVLIVTGSPGPHNAANRAYLDQLRERAARSRGGAVLLHDAVGRPLPYRALADLFALADALVFPSESEGFGIPLLEAALARLPIVCSDIPPHRAVARDAATYVPPDAGAAVIADAIERALSTEAARLRSRVRREHDWARILRERVVPLVLGRAAARRTA